jgi:tetratricopeptide (TPR) repeat protein
VRRFWGGVALLACGLSATWSLAEPASPGVAPGAAATGTAPAAPSAPVAAATGTAAPKPPAAGDASKKTSAGAKGDTSGNTEAKKGKGAKDASKKTGKGDDKKKSAPEVTPAQVEALATLAQEAAEYERGARDYQRLLTGVVKHHFAERRRRVVESLDREIEHEKESLTLARDEAIRRFEKFLERYQGPEADPDATPDAMYRLAALYEERARVNFDVELSESLKPAIALYRRIITEFPDYDELAGVHYYLGHAYTDAIAFDEAQQAFRALVCNNRYQVKDDGKGGLALAPLPQDRDQGFWGDWFMNHPTPLDQLPGGRPLLDVTTRDEELTFLDPYQECVALPQKVEEGEEPRYVAEVWWKLGNFHFDQMDQGGPYSLNRAASAYTQSLEFKKPPLHGVAMYKRAWTSFKQQRYRAAVEWFGKLLVYADVQEKDTGDAGVDFREEAYTYIATSLTYVDFDGPGPDDPYIPRSDVLDLEQNPLVAERKMRVAIDRVQDPAIIPQDQPWTVEIYKALATEFVDLGQQRNAIDALALTLQRFPLDRDAPELQNRIADLYYELAEQAPPGSPLREEITAQALAARTELARFVGKTDWTRANRDDPEALRKAEELVRAGLQQAAADHTNTGRDLVARAEQVTDPYERVRLLEKGLEEYRLAAKGWRAFIDQDPNGLDAYESSFWYADARYWDVIIQLDLGRVPPWTEVKQALTAAGVVRDSNEDDRFMQPAAFYGVAIADKLLDARYRENTDSGGTSGFPRRDEVAFSGTGMERKVVKLSLPQEVSAAIEARDDYNRRIPLGSDPQKNGLLYAFQAAEYYFVYGDFDGARERFEPMMAEYCGQNEWGYRAWEKLISMSNFSGDAERSRKLVEGQSCAFDEETRAAEEAIRTPVRSGVAYLDARKVYDEADKMEPGEARDKKWREAASAYKVALEAAPDRDEAPEAAMNGAFAYKQVGEYDEAIAMYELFISRYGTEEKLRTLVQGDPEHKPPLDPDPAQYEQRVKFLKMAYDALANAYVLFFDYPKAAATFDRTAAVGHFSAEDRKASAQQAIGLYASLGDRAGMQRAETLFDGLGATPAEAAQVDFLVKSAALKAWDPYSPDTGANRTAREGVETAMREYYDRNSSNPGAFRYVVEAAYWVAKAKNAAGSNEESRWWQQTVAAFDLHRQTAEPNEDGTSSALGSPQASLAAEAAYRLLDAQVKTDFDYDSGRHRFKGTPQEVLTQYSGAAVRAKDWYDRLGRIVDDYASPEWGTAAIARQGTLYDSLRSALYNTRPPDLVMFDEKTEAILRRAEESDNLDLQEKADALRVKAETTWQDTREREIGGADQVMVDRYVRAIFMAQKYNVTNPAIVRAIQRLAFFTELLGDAKIRTYAGAVPEVQYTDGMYLRSRPGLVTAPEPNGLVPAAPSQGGQ